MKYLRVTVEDPLPDLSALRPFKAVVIVEEELPAGRRAEVSGWLVRSGCLYMMAWGVECSRWDDSVDEANLEQFGYGEIPDEELVFTTWHDDELLKDVFWFAKHSAHHPDVDLQNYLLLHVAPASRERELTELFEDA